MKNQVFLTFFLLNIFFIFTNKSEALIDLDASPSSFVLESKKIEIPGYPHAFNPSIIRWKGSLLLTFRHIPNPKSSFVSYIGIARLDEEFTIIGIPQILETQDRHSSIPSRADDSRLIAVGDSLFLVFSDNKEAKISKKGFRVYLARLTEKGNKFNVHDVECLSHFEGESPLIREKNWTPFSHEGNLLLSYSITPHRILRPLLHTNSCETLCQTATPFPWEWGEPRGGTTALLEGDEYLAFFHSSLPMKTKNSSGKEVLHYFMGAYTYSKHPPFTIQRISPSPIIGKGFYKGDNKTPYWGSKKVIFPVGYIADDSHIWISYGRQDKECWIVKLDKKRFLESLIIHK